MKETDYLVAARQLAPMVAQLRDRFDPERQLPRSLVDELHAAGLFGMWLPRSMGGAELAPLPFLEVIEELARQDGSVGWCTVIPAGHGRLAGALDEDVAHTIFGTGRGVLAGTLNPVGKAVAVPGGYRVTGRWGYGSFIGYADWVLGNCIADDGSLRLCLFPLTEVEGIRRLACHRAACDRQQRLSGDRPVRAGAPHDTNGGLSAAATPPGAALRDPDDQRVRKLHCHGRSGNRRGRDRCTGGDRCQQTNRRWLDHAPRQPLAQADLVRAEALVGSARAYLFSELGRMWEGTLAGCAASDARACNGETGSMSRHAMRDQGGGPGISVGGWRGAGPR